MQKQGVNNGSWRSTDYENIINTTTLKNTIKSDRVLLAPSDFSITSLTAVVGVAEF
jgi:hypothetical protein